MLCFRNHPRSVVGLPPYGMALYSISNQSRNQLSVPEPVGRVLAQGETIVVSLGASDMDNAIDIKRLVQKGLLSVAVNQDILAPDSMEIMPVGFGGPGADLSGLQNDVVALQLDVADLWVYAEDVDSNLSAQITDLNTNLSADIDVVEASVFALGVKVGVVYNVDVTTLNTTPITALTITLEDAGVTYLDVTVAGSDGNAGTASDAYVLRKHFALRSHGGSITEIAASSSLAVASGSLASVTAVLVYSGLDVLVRLTGLATGVGWRIKVEQQSSLPTT